MTVAFFHDGPQLLDRQGNIHNGVLNDEIISRYFYRADKLVSVTRFRAGVNLSEATQIRHENVEFVEVPDMNTLSGRLFKTAKAKKIIEQQVKNADWVVARVPSYVAILAIRYAVKHKKSYLTEVVGCAWDAFWNYSAKGKLMAPLEYVRMRKAVKNAPHVIYVTNAFLQKRYPTKGVAEACSNVQIQKPDDSVLQTRKQRIANHTEMPVLGTTAVVDVPYKGQRFVIAALAELKKRGVLFQYELTGGGDQTALHTLARELGVANQVVFKGLLSHGEVISWLDSLDIYIQPSLTEGMPRALIEAMSRGLPCIGGNVGGIPELLEQEYVVDMDKHCVERICQILLSMDRETVEAQSRRNYNEAKQYYFEEIQKRRNCIIAAVAEEVGI